MNCHVELTTEILASLLDYNKSTGGFTWKHRDEKYFPSKRHAAAWNSRRAGTPAGNLGKNGYRIIMVLGRTYKAHQLAWFLHTGTWAQFVDHENRVRSDNRIINLRAATRSQNNKNKSLYANNKTGAPGISYDKRQKKWRAVVYSDRKSKSVGSFKTLAEAVEARLAAQGSYGFHKTHGVAR